MLEVKGSRVYLTQGDTAYLVVALEKPDGTTYTMASGDTLTMTVKDKPTGTAYATFTSSTNTISMDASSTANIPVGSCCFDIQLTRANGEIYTVVGCTNFDSHNFICMPQVTA